jgi:hypothetical protein
MGLGRLMAGRGDNVCYWAVFRCHEHMAFTERDFSKDA